MNLFMCMRKDVLILDVSRWVEVNMECVLRSARWLLVACPSTVIEHTT